jgi:hypothetical protein
MVVEAIADGVVLRTLAKAREAATLAVAYCYPKISEVQALGVGDFAGRQLNRKYNYAGIGRQALNKFDKYCIIQGGITCYVLSKPSIDRKSPKEMDSLVHSSSLAHLRSRTGASRATFPGSHSKRL